MRRLAALLLLLGAALAPVAAENQAKGIDWHHDFDGAMELAKKEGRPLVAYFTFET